MASLRSRVLASVLLLAAAGLVLLAAVTYAEQRSFLQGRVDQEVTGAVNAMSFQLDRSLAQSGRDPGTGAAVGLGSRVPRGDGGRPGGPGGGPGGGGPNLNLPPGTYGQRRDASGTALMNVEIKYSESEQVPAAPKLAANVPLGKLFTVGSAGSSSLRYRVFAKRDPEDTGITIAAVPMREVDQTLGRLLLVEGLVVGGVLLALGAIGFFVVRLGLRPLDRIEVTAGEIAAGQLSRRVSPATPRTEVGRLGLALNAMLDRLERAFAERTASEERLRQFLSDASHELRTPLASIRGYAELHRMGATEDAAGAELAMRRIEDESKRMGVLVEDLLMLARLDEEPELRRQPVNVAALARDAGEDARAVAPERAITVSAPEAAVVSGDPHQLRQVLANLTRNALVHTPAGSPIEISVADGEDTVTIEVRDHGPGLPASSRDSLFDRFWRAEGGRERGKAGAGLGLAIVQGVLQAHGGQVTAQDAPGGGALFAVRLPKTAPEPAPRDAS